MVSLLSLLIYLNRALVALFGIACLFFNFTFIGAPSWLPLPWVAVGDFVGGLDGSVYVALQGERVLRYDADGDFVASYKTGPVMMEGDGSDMQLAVDTTGKVYLKIDYEDTHWRTVDNIRVYSPDWREYTALRFERILPDVSDRERRAWAWRLGSSGRIEFVSRSDLPCCDKPVGPGELLFSGRHESNDRTRFDLPDGSHLERDGYRIARVSPAGDEIAVYRQAWYLWPFGNVVARYASNMVVFIIVLVVMGSVDEWLRRRRARYSDREARADG